MLTNVNQIIIVVINTFPNVYSSLPTCRVTVGYRSTSEPRQTMRARLRVDVYVGLLKSSLSFYTAVLVCACVLSRHLGRVSNYSGRRIRTSLNEYYRFTRQVQERQVYPTLVLRHNTLLLNKLSGGS